jgi:hypothetical protein
MNEDDKSRLWVKLIIALLLITGIGIGLAIQKNCEPIRKLNDNVLTAFNSSLQIKEQTMGLVMFDLTEEVEVVTKTDAIVENIIQCESQNQMVWGDLNYYEKGVNIRSYGVAQFQERTFNYLKGLANADQLNFYDRDDQVYLLKWAIENGYGYLWSCYRILYN